MMKDILNYFLHRNKYIINKIDMLLINYNENKIVSYQEIILVLQEAKEKLKEKDPYENLNNIIQLQQDDKKRKVKNVLQAAQIQLFKIEDQNKIEIN